jgi:hypothetical protein
VALCIALAVHVADEAAHDFLALYNPTAQALRAHVPWLALPVFSFQVWLAGLAVAVLALLALSPLAFRRSRIMRPVAWAFAALMTANALGHVGASLYLRRLAPGVLSSPLLLAASGYLLARLRNTA